MWMREDDTVYVLPEEPGDETVNVCPVANLREWCRLAAADLPDWRSRRRYVISAYLMFVGRN